MVAQRIVGVPQTIEVDSCDDCAAGGEPAGHALQVEAHPTSAAEAESPDSAACTTTIPAASEGPPPHESSTGRPTEATEPGRSFG